jgi:hypothetical protein
MIALPQGVSINYNIKIVITDLNIEIFEWCRDVGAKVWVENKPFDDRRGIAKEMPMVQFGRAKPCYHLQDGSSDIMLNFTSEDAGTALTLLMKFDTYVVSHNMKEVEKYVY